ncbi:MAG: glycoside hydrolase N-terminal domain-containing protein [Lachnospiraceae bacterium]|nr:glycoside hydrolase N-terminal domain-containing protein [Lachnospiraceae bacterium]
MIRKVISIFLAAALMLQGTAFVGKDSTALAAESETQLKTWYTSPANDWESEATPLGNGFIGAMVFGGVESDKIQVNEHSIWSGGPGANPAYDGGWAGDSASVKNALQQVRQALQDEMTTFTNTKSAYRNGNGDIIANNYSNSQTVLSLISQLKGEKNNFGTYQTLGNIFIDDPEFTEPMLENATSNAEPVNGGEMSTNLFDGSTGTKWYSGNSSVGNNITFPIIVSWNYSGQKKFNRYAISSANDMEGRDPYNWKLYGSNDGNNYTVVDTRNGETFSARYQTKTYQLSSTCNYKYYKLEITATREGMPPQLSEIELINTNKTNADYTDYVRSLDLNTAVETVSYTQNGTRYTKEYFISYPDNVMVIRLSANRSGMIDRQIYVNSEQTNKTVSVSGNTITMTGQPADQRADGLKFAQQIKVIPQNGTLTQIYNGVRVSGADSVLIVMSCGTNYVQCTDATFNYFSNENPLTAVANRVNSAVSKGYNALLAAHLADYKALFNRVDVSFGSTTLPSKPTDALLSGYNKTNTNAENRYLEMLYYQFGRYLLISCSREGSLPANLQGIWAQGLSSPWDSDYHTNINLQMNYWLAQQCNLAECHTAVVDYINSLVPRGTQTADYYFVKQNGGPVRGWVTFHENNIWGNTGPAVSDAFYFPAAAAWLCQDIWEYYQYNMDTQFLAQNFNTMLSAALFWVDNLWLDSRDGTLVSNPSYSPEHGSYSLGASCDQEIIWELFNMVLEAADILNINTSEIAEVRTAMSRLYLPRIGLAGEYLEWKDETAQDIVGDYGHRHVNQLFALHPGTLVVAGRSAQDDANVEAMKTVLNVRGDGGTGWSKAWKINMWARLRDGNHAGVMVNQILLESTLKNLFDTHAPFQIDGNFGATAGMTEMLLQSQGDSIDLLAALPDMWSNGYASGIKARGNFEVSMDWSSKNLNYAVIKSNSGSDCVVSYNGIAGKPVYDSRGRQVSYNTLNANRISFATTPGETYYINTYPENVTPDEYNITYISNGNIVAQATLAKGESPAQFYHCPAENNRLFAGWFTRNVQLNSVSDINNAKNYAAVLSDITDETTLYAGWIDAGSRLEIIGAQIRITNPSGLRFLTKIGNDLISKVEALNGQNVPLKPDSPDDKGIGFGTVVTKAANVSSTELVKDVNAAQAARGMVVSPAEKIFDTTADSLIYTCVITGIGSGRYTIDISARSYITYMDVNNTEQTYYYTETNAASNAGGGYKTNVYAVANVLYNSADTSASMKAWLKQNIIDAVN